MQRLSLPLLVTAIMTPQILETLYSPALTAIRSDFGISAAQAGQTLSIYFFCSAAKNSGLNSMIFRTSERLEK